MGLGSGLRFAILNLVAGVFGSEESQIAGLTPLYCALTTLRACKEQDSLDSLTYRD